MDDSLSLYKEQPKRAWKTDNIALKVILKLMSVAHIN